MDTMKLEGDDYDKTLAGERREKKKKNIIIMKINKFVGEVDKT